MEDLPGPSGVEAWLARTAGALRGGRNGKQPAAGCVFGKLSAERFDGFRGGALGGGDDLDVDYGDCDLPGGVDGVGGAGLALGAPAGGVSVCGDAAGWLPVVPHAPDLRQAGTLAAHA